MYWPLAVLPDTALHAPGVGAAFAQEFLAPKGDSAVNSYGYKVLRQPTRTGRPKL